MSGRRARTERRRRPGALAAPPADAARRAHRLVLAAFFLSGFAGLMHQVVWAKLLVGLIGATVHAQAAVLAVFMGGLALGAVRFGRRADDARAPLRIYVALELAIGAYCCVLPWIVDGAGTAYVLLALRFDAAPELALRLGLALATVLLPAVLMGGTLPVLARQLVGSLAQTRPRVAQLYALNSFGAVLGAATAGFLTLPWLGLHASLLVASSANLVAAALLLPRARRELRSRAAAPAPASSAAAPVAETFRPSQHRIALAALFASGFAAMGYEVLFSRVIALAFGASAYSFSVMLISFIFGIALGSLAVAQIPVRRPLFAFALAQLGVATSLLALTPLVSRLPYLGTWLRFELAVQAAGFELLELAHVLLATACLLLPTICLGAGFPLVAQIHARQPGELGARVGSSYAWNTLGNLFGALGTSLVLLPQLGLLHAFHLLVAASLAAGLALLLASVDVPWRRRLAALAPAAAVGAAYALSGAGWLDPVRLAVGQFTPRRAAGPARDPAVGEEDPTASFEAWKRSYLAGSSGAPLRFFEEDGHATVVVAGSDRELALVVDGKPDASLNSNDLETQLLLGHVPLFLAPRARSLLVVGYGSGITAGAALRHPVERADVVEISRAVLNADPLYALHNHRALADPRVQVFEEDGQSFLRTTSRRYDVVISEPSNPWMAGVSALFTREFFEAVAAKLAPGGVFCFWFHTYWQSDASVALILRTLGAVFPHTLAFADDDFGNVIVLASRSPVEPDFAAMEQRFEDPRVRHDLARLGMPNLTALLSHHRLSDARLRLAAGRGALNHAGHERLEYAAPRSLFRDEHSELLESFDPLLQSPEQPADTLLDAYIAWRATSGRPVTAEELALSARYASRIGGYGLRIAQALRWRSLRAARPQAAPQAR